MEKPDISKIHSSSDGLITCVSAITKKAHPNSESEIHSHHGEFEIYYFSEGDLFFAFEGRRIEVDAGTVIIIAANTLHRPIIKNPCRYVRKRILFSKKVFTKTNAPALELLNRLGKKKILVFSSKTANTLGFDNLIGEIKNHLSLISPYNDFCALVSLFSLLIKAIENDKESRGDNFNSHISKAAEIIDFIDLHLQEDLSYKKISEQFYMSEKNLYKFFKKETGFTLGSYINERKIIKARSLLNSGSSAAEAAAAAGFKDYSTFYRTFLKKTGITPMQYIKNTGNQNS